MAAADPLDQLRGYVVQTLNLDKATREGAEAYLATVEHQPGFPTLMLRLIEVHCAGTTPDDKVVRQTAAVLFKNLVKRCWNPEDPSLRLNEQDQVVIKQHMVNYMCSTPPEVQRQLSEALSIISKHDFPAKWQELLPELVSKFSIDNFHVTNGVLVTANSILKRFRYQFKSDDLFRELKYCLDNLQEPLLQLFQATCERVTALSAQPSNGNPEIFRQLGPMVEGLRLMARIFYSLNWQDLPAYFEDHMAQWMTLFLGFLSYQHPLLVDPDNEDEPGPVDKLQVAIVENVALYTEKYEDEFQGHVPAFTERIWQLLITLTPMVKHDLLASASIGFLTTVVSKQRYGQLFQSQESLAQIVQQIVVPNLTLREADVELFEDNHTEWIQRDMEGSDQDTRRRCACELVRGMCALFEAQTTSICGAHIQHLLQEYSTDPNNRWQSKDAAILLLLSISIKSQSSTSGVSQVNSSINIMDILNAHILPELADPNVNQRPIVRADGIKFLTLFRGHLPVELLGQCLAFVLPHLRAESVVLQSYAAHFIERILTIKDKTAQGAVPRFGRAQLQPMLDNVFDGLFSVLAKADASFENEFVMKATMRVLNVARDDIVQHTPVVLGALNTALQRICGNPRNPQFNHYLFESIAVLVRGSCGSNPALTGQFESLLFPPFQSVLQLDLSEFSPYVFQILSQLLEYRPDGLSDAYRALFPPLLAPTNWERKGNCPPLVRLLKAYLKQGAAEVLPHLGGMLGVFQKLLAFRPTEHNGFELLEALVMHVPPEAMEPFLPDLFQILLMRLQANQTTRFALVLTHFFSLFVIRHSPDALTQRLEAVQAGMTTMILSQVWVKAIEASPPEYQQAKVCAVGMARLLVESTPVKADPGLWTQLMGATVTVLAPATSSGAAAEEDDEPAEFDGDAPYSKLHFAASLETDPLPTVSDPGATVAQMLAGLCQGQPGVFMQRIAQLPVDKQTALQDACTRAGVQLV